MPDLLKAMGAHIEGGGNNIVRVHGYEVHTDLTQINWAKVDDVLFVAPYLREFALRQAPRLHVTVSARAPSRASTMVRSY